MNNEEPRLHLLRLLPPTCTGSTRSKSVSCQRAPCAPLERRGVLDIDSAPDGTPLIGVTREELLKLDDQGRYELIASIDTPRNTNGLAIDSTGRIFLTQSDDEGSQAYTVTQRGDIDVLGDLSPYQSSGDCVVLKDDSLLMTAPSEYV